MLDPGDWGLLTGITVAWASLALLFLTFLAGASRHRRRRGLTTVRVLGAAENEPPRDERRELLPLGRPAAPGRR